MQGTFTAVFQKTDKWWISFIEEIPGVNTQGKTKEEARENLKEALELIIQSNKEITEKEMSVDENSIKENLTVTV